MTPLPAGVSPWPTPDPFLFCVHHDDAYPLGNDVMGPAASLAGREIGQDFAGKDGWRMYHGRAVPGFPAHPHRGFETVTVVRRGLLDHSDSLGAAARYGGGDVQWLTAGAGIQHAEMFPLLSAERDNPVELFQIWLNLPAADKFAAPHFSMLWNEVIPRHLVRDDAGGTTEVAVVAGTLEGKRAASPPPSSWAAKPTSDVAIWTVKLSPGARWRMPAASPGANRWLYVWKGGDLAIDGQPIPAAHVVELRSNMTAQLMNGSGECEALLLQGQPIGEPVVKHGPFVMNTKAEIHQAIRDYQVSQFGGWSWPSSEPVHPRDAGRFARHADGKVDRPA
ncbi:MAG: pirin-like C-terminal cupin domain-containing protein [Kofleriaceae bacterium]|nr:pirin-like C-terminal cupin domain-containing protein [Kofleriaceae bacterium]